MSSVTLKKLKRATQRLTRWDSSGLTFGHINRIDRDDNLFEFYCYMRFLKDLNNNYHVTFVPGDKDCYFPMSSANKMGKPRFDLNHKRTQTKFQLCYGTKIKLNSSPDTTHAPDISLQKANSGEDPSEQDVLIIWDAKYKAKGGKLRINLIREFAQIIVDFKINNTSSTILDFDTLKNLKANCLITNGEVASLHKGYSRNHDLK